MCLLLLLKILLRPTPHLYPYRSRRRARSLLRRMARVVAPRGSRAMADTGASVARNGVFAEARPSTVIRVVSRGLACVRKILRRVHRY
jgi:hypothetical protein